jgi:uncharacterized protein YciI
VAYFVLMGFDRPYGKSLRAAVRPDHVAYVKAQGDIVKVAGPLLSPDNEPIGSLIIIDVADREAAGAFQRDDPYTRAELFASNKIVPWALVLGKFL